MAQETLDGLLQYMLVTLSLQEKQWLAQQLLLDVQDQERRPTVADDLLDAHLDNALQQINEGKVYSQAEAKQIRQKYAQRLYSQSL